jgi:hypothetical protein
MAGQAAGMSESIDPEDTISYDDTRDQHDRERDGVGSMRDTDEEQGDEVEVTDQMELDTEAAREAGADLDRIGGETPRLD